MKCGNKNFSTVMALLFLLLVAVYFSYQIGKDAARRDARIKLEKTEKL